MTGAKRRFRSEQAKAKSLETFNQELAEVHMTGQWIYEELLNRAIGGPRPRGDAYLWPWKMVHGKLLEACDVLEESFTARRSVSSVIPV